MIDCQPRFITLICCRASMILFSTSASDSRTWKTVSMTLFAFFGCGGEVQKKRKEKKVWETPKRKEKMNEGIYDTVLRFQGRPQNIPLLWSSGRCIWSCATLVQQSSGPLASSDCWWAQRKKVCEHEHDTKVEKILIPVNWSRSVRIKC